MAFTRLSLTISLLLLSHIVASLASEYGDALKPELEKKGYESTPNSEELEKPKPEEYSSEHELRKSDIVYKHELNQHMNKPKLEKHDHDIAYGKISEHEKHEHVEYSSEHELKKPEIPHVPKPELEKHEEKEYGHESEQELEKIKHVSYGPKSKFEEHDHDIAYDKKPQLGEHKHMGYAPELELEKSKPVEYSPEPKPEVEKHDSKEYGYNSELEKHDHDHIMHAPKEEMNYGPKLESKENNHDVEYEHKSELEKYKHVRYTKESGSETKTNGYGSLKAEVEKHDKVHYLKEGGKKVEYGNGYGLKSDEYKEKAASYVIGVQGIIYCKSGSRLIPLKGALARITCLITKDGYESSPFSLLSQPTDEKGYFLATLFQNHQNSGDVSQCNCKAFLEKSSLESCKIATDVNKGTSGASLSKSYRVIEKKKIKLYSVGPFFYTAKTKSSANGY